MLPQLLPKPSNDAEGHEAQVEALLRMGEETEETSKTGGPETFWQLLMGPSPMIAY